MKDFNGKVAVVTGAASGIGRALAIRFDELGCNVALSDVNKEGLAETAAQLKNKHFAETLDVADKDAFYAHAEKVKAELGDAQIIINNAGVAVSDTVEHVSYEDFEWIMGINFWGVVYGTKAFLPQIKARGEGAIVNISSVFGIIAVPTQGTYNATKFAVRGFTEALRHELEAEGSKVQAICVHPGGITTNIAASSRYHVGPDGSTDREKAAAEFKKFTATSPEKAAETIINGIRKNAPRVLIGTDARMIDSIQRRAPVRYYRIIKRLSFGKL